MLIYGFDVQYTNFSNNDSQYFVNLKCKTFNMGNQQLLVQENVRTVHQLTAAVDLIFLSNTPVCYYTNSDWYRGNN